MGKTTKYILASIAIFLSHSFASTLIVRLSDLHTMAQKSDIVVHGYVGEQKVVHDELNRLITLTYVEVVDGLYGLKTGEVFTIYQVGGQKDGIVMPLLGGHHYNVGQEVILFGLKLGTSYVSYGAGQGKFDVVPDGDQELVKEDLGDVLSIGNQSATNDRPQKPIPLQFESKKNIIDEIRLMIKNR